MTRRVRTAALRILGLALALTLSACLTPDSTDYKKPSLSVSTLKEVRQMVDDGMAERAIQYLTALQNQNIDIPESEYRPLFEEAADLLERQYTDAFLENDFLPALSKHRSLESIGRSPEFFDLPESEILLAASRKYIAEGRTVPGLTLFQRILYSYEIPTSEILLFAETAHKEMNRAVMRQIRDILVDRGEPVPAAISTILDKTGDFEEMIQGTATIWVNRGLRVESGVGYPDRAIGSGFFIDKRGYLLTNYHVISSEVDPEYEGFSRLYIKTSNDPDTKIPAKVIGFDRIFDIALLKVEVEPEYVYSLSEERDFLPGEQLYAIGSPVGLENTITSGIVSAQGRRFLQIGDAIQVDVPVNSGNSGGPLIDKNGRLVGIIFAGIEQFEGINFAIPAYWVHLFLPDLYDKGEVVHPWIGAAVKTSDNGLEIVYVVPGENGDMAGLRQGDIITSIAGNRVTSLKEVQHLILTYLPETLVTVKWNRKGKAMQGQIVLGERPYRPMDIAIKRDTRENLVVPLFGMVLEETDNVFWRPNYTVRKVYKGSIADETGLSEDDPVSIQRWQINDEFRVAILQLYVMKRTAGFLEKAVQLAAYLEIDTFI